MLVSDIKLIEPLSKVCNRHHIREIYEYVSSHGDERHHRKRLSKQVRRYEFIEVLIRCAYVKYGYSRNLEVASSLDMFMEESMHRCFGNNFADDGSIFRKDFFADEHVIEVCNQNINFLSLMYVLFTRQAKRITTMRLSDFIHFLDSFELFEPGFTKREASFVFSSCITEVNKHAVELDFVGFIEALIRTSGIKKVPSNHDMELLGVQSVGAFYRRKNSCSIISHFKDLSVSSHAHWISYKTDKMHVEENIPYIERLFSYIQDSYNDGVKFGKKYQLEATFKLEVRQQTLLTMYQKHGFDRGSWKKKSENDTKEKKKDRLLKAQVSFKRKPPSIEFWVK